MDPFYIAAFVASSELNDLSQNASIQCCLKSRTFTLLYLKTKIPISGPFSFFTSPKKGLNLPTLLADAVLIKIVPLYVIE